ncbi:MAG TPA: tyrosine-type recombinase/integrase, partial [Pirellulaceae bacterium]|nr:tyrosine-type recombinase/integrase [Pirellulaceae bacterium]
MASIVKLGKGKQPPRAIDFFDVEGKRQRLRIGKVTHDVATEFKRRIEKLIGFRRLGQLPDSETISWLNGLSADVRGRLAQFDLCQLPEFRKAAPKLGKLLDDYVEQKRVELKASSVKRLENTFQKMKDYFKPDTLITEITTSNAKDWRIQMLKSGLSEASIRTNARNAKSVFRDAVERKYLSENPFLALVSTSVAAERTRFVTEDETNRLLAACPNADWKCLVGLARLAGLRVPSESHSLNWTDVDWNKMRLTVFATKTDSTRIVPISPQLMEILQENYQQAADKDGRIVALTGHNRHRQMIKIVKAAGLEPWDDLYQTLRRSCETQWAMTVPQHAVSAWIGHSELVSAKHYLQVTDALFDRVTGQDSGDCKQKSAAESAAVKPGIEGQDGESESDDTRTELEGAAKNPDNCRGFLDVAATCQV